MKICSECKQMRIIPFGVTKCADCLVAHIQRIGDQIAEQLHKDTLEFIRQTGSTPAQQPIAFKEFRELQRQQRQNDRRLHSAPKL